MLKGAPEPDVGAVCAVCFDSVYDTQGFECSQKCGTFTCWSCLLQCYIMASKPDAVQGQSNPDGELLCSNGACNHPITIVDLVRSNNATDNVLKAQEAFKIQVLTSKKVTEALNQQQIRIQAEYAHFEQIKNPDEKAAVKLRLKIIDEVLTLRCPRCKGAFADFDGCFALKCVHANCGCGFCAWCLTDCGKDAHKHVLECPENPRRKHFNTEAAFKIHHRMKRIDAMQELIKQAHLRKSAVDKLKDLLKTDLEHLQIPLSDVFPASGDSTLEDDDDDSLRVLPDKHRPQSQNMFQQHRWERQRDAREREWAQQQQERQQRGLLEEQQQRLQWILEQQQQLRLEEVHILRDQLRQPEETLPKELRVQRQERLEHQQREIVKFYKERVMEQQRLHHLRQQALAHPEPFLPPMDLQQLRIHFPLQQAP